MHFISTIDELDRIVAFQGQRGKALEPRGSCEQGTPLPKKEGYGLRRHTQIIVLGALWKIRER